MKSNNILLYTSAPYKKEQNLAERYVYTVKDGMRTIMAYNNCPIGYWCYALEYFCYTFNRLPRMGRKFTRDEDFYGIRPDISNAVPFYAAGYFHNTLEERISKPRGKVFEDKATPGYMLGYADSNTYHTSKNSYLILTAFPHTVVTRHDCTFSIYTESTTPSLLDADELQREQSTFKLYDEVNYDELLGNSKSTIHIEELHDNSPPDNTSLPETPIIRNQPTATKVYPSLPQEEEVLPEQEVMATIKEEVRKSIILGKRKRDETDPVPTRVTRNQGNISPALQAIYKAMIVSETNKKPCDQRVIRCHIRKAVQGPQKEDWWKIFQKKRRNRSASYCNLIR